MLKGIVINILAVIIVAGIYSCGAGGDDQGTEYAPNMYHAVSYEPLKQITDESAGSWLSNREDGKGEYFNSNINNPYLMNLRLPPANTVRRDKDGYNPFDYYSVPKDSFDYAAKFVKNPLDSTTEIVDEGKALYTIYCTHCHGESGAGDGLVGEIFLGVAAYNMGRVKDLPEGHLFHTITHGRGRMYPHASQVAPDDRWKIVRYVQVLQNQN